MTKIYNYAFLIWLVSAPIALQAQIKEPGFPSANAASLGKYGDYPVSHHTGVPDISIPIYTVQEGDLSLPISMNYHASGIKVDEVASWVGLGWSLNAGGVITRSVVGAPDEGGYPLNGNVRSDRGGWGWYKNGGYPPEMFDCGSPNPGCFSTQVGSECDCLNYYQDAANGYLDTEPDIFTFNVMGHSGKFYFDENKQPHFIPKKDYIVKPIDAQFSAWTITAPDGMVFYFGGAGATENSFSGLSTLDMPKVSTSWYLTRIESPNKKHNIYLTYVAENYSYGTRGGHSMTYQEGNSCPLIGSFNAETLPTINNINGIRLSKITTGSLYTEINFIASASLRTDLTSLNSILQNNTQAKSLETIEIKNGSICKKFTLKHSYFQSLTSSSYPAYGHTYDARRLKLNSIQESSCTGSILFPAHQFSYIEGPAFTMARRYSLGKDAWGYYNGADSNQGLLPTMTVFVNPCGYVNFNGGANRTSNETKMKSWTLNEITFPTGGASLFEYEAHRYIVGSVTNIVGGLRIKKITSNDGKGSTIVKNYTYDSGILYAGLPKYDQYPKGQSNEATVYYSALNIGTIISSSPNPPLKTTLGYHIGYTNVTETRSDNSQIVFFYVNGHPTNFNLKYPAAPPSYDFGSGELKSSTHRDNVGVNKYFSDNISSQKGTLNSTYTIKVALLPCYNNVTPGDCSELLPFYTEYYLKSAYHLLDKTIEIKDGVTKEINYTYTSDLKHSNPKTITETNSDGKVVKKEFTYPSDAGSGAPAVMWDNTLSTYRNMTAPVIRERTLVNNVLKQQQVNNYQLLFTNKVLLTSVDEYPTGTSEFIKTNYTYDSNGNLTESKRGNNPSSSFLWGYKNMFPIAKVDNASKNEFFFTSFEEETAGVTTSDFRSGTKSKTGGYTKSLTGLTTGKTYILSYWQKPSSTWVYNSTEVVLTSPTTSYTISLAGQVDDVRFYPKDALINTYTYQPNIGITSQSNHFDDASFMDYDEFGRLISIKDYNKDILKSYTYNYKKSILVSPNSLSLTGSSSSNTVNVTSTINWTVEIPPASNWISVTPTSGFGDQTLTVNVGQNNTTPRTGSFKVKGDGLESTVNITQSDGSPFLTVSPSSLTFGSSTSALPVSIQSNVAWTTQITYWSGSNWLSLQPSSGTGNATMNVVKLQSPPSGQQYNAEIRITGGGFTRYVSVTSNGN
ncbi:BACON domain-containing protein [Algoriphagus sp. D3-2-R+10]|uniref:BACON domain-containing protein n=1 Tax=Algoriphagus aurantiacus TaxID=3103948 RepID=UPI002B37A30D|nr:BACON domain-containing protein [Algoriphagus sp. D3-2-R+10]MEB2774651.1 BACON domain-containing protein [Algoriphagus sp. D3-2-R+10]